MEHGHVRSIIYSKVLNNCLQAGLSVCTKVYQDKAETIQKPPKRNGDIWFERTTADKQHFCSNDTRDYAIYRKSSQEI